MRILASQARARCLKGALKELFDPRLGGRIRCSSSAFVRLARLVRLALVALAALAALACAHTPPPGHQVVTAVDIRGDTTGEEAELRRGIATRADASYDPSTLAKDLARIERFYRARGYYDATTRAARVLNGENDRVRVEIVVVPGKPVRVARIDLIGLAGLPKNVVAKARSVL